MNNSALYLAPRKASWRKKKVSCLQRPFCHKEKEHLHLGITQWNVLIRLDQVWLAHWREQELWVLCSTPALTDVSALRVEKTAGTFVKWFSAGKMAFQFQIFIGGRMWTCPVTVGELFLMECKLFSDLYKHDIFKGVVALPTVENDTQITTHHIAIK